MLPSKLRPVLASLSTLALLACPAAGTPEADTKKADVETHETNEAKAGDAEEAPAKTEKADDTDAEEPAAAKLDAKKTQAKRAEAKKKFAATDEAKVRANRAKLLSLLNEGRKLVKGGELDAGIAKYGEVLAIDPHYGPALGELGWAEFKKGNYSDAHAHTLRALPRATDNDRRGMLHYNLGRIAEAQDQTEVAVAAYELSLSLRPNDIVASRLDNLTHAVDAAGEHYVHPAVEEYNNKHAPEVQAKPEAFHALATGVSSLEEACKIADADSACMGEDPCALVASPGADQSWGLMTMGSVGFLSCWHPIVKTDAGWTVFTTALISQWGTEVDQDVDALSARVVANETGSYLWIDFSDHVYERDWSWGELEEDEDIPGSDMTDTEGVILCKRDTAVTCTMITTKYAYANSDDTIRERYEAKLRLRGDVIVVEDVVTEGDVDFAYNEEWNSVTLIPAGEYPFAEIAAPVHL